MREFSHVEGEAALLGAVLIDNKIIPSIRFLHGDDFAVPVHGRIFDLVAQLTDAGQTVSPVTLRPLVAEDPGLHELGGPPYLARLTANGEGLLIWRELALQISDLAARRRARSLIENPEVPIAVVHEQLSTHLSNAGASRPLPVIDPASWDQPAPPRRAFWGAWLPLRQTTMLTGEGGVGKSLLSQQLASCIALGVECLGRATIRVPVLYCTVEDDAAELHRRQVAIMRAIGTSARELAGELHLASLAGDDNAALAQFTPDGRMTPTDRWRTIERFTREAAIKVLIIDNATDAMAGDHNDLHQVARFVNMLTGWAIDRDGAVLLLHHPSKAGHDWLGSVAWTNKVRNRLTVRRDADAHDADCRVIESAKANYGRTGDKVAFRWLDGAFVPDADLPDSMRQQLDEVSGANAANAAFLACLDICTAKRRNVSHNPGRNFAPRLFTRMAEGKGFTAKDFEGALERLWDIGAIEVDAELWPDAGRRPRRGIRRTGALL